jgi:glyoxylase-like metal-dependent hydrolase (beta-lactamase superfamily II)
MLAGPDADRFMPGDDALANAAFVANLQEGLDFLRQAAQDRNLHEFDQAGFAQAAREFEQFGREMAVARRVPPTETFEENLILPDRTRPVEVRFMGRANTAGDAIVWLPLQRTVFAGDVVVSPVPFGFNAYPADWIEVLSQLKALDFQTLVPGHGRPMHDSLYLDRLTSMLHEVRTQLAPIAATDMTAQAASAQVDLDAMRDVLVGEDPWLRRWFRNYWKDPIVSSALREARGQPIVQGTE